MTEEITGEWQTCVVDNEYEIWSENPYPIRRKGKDRIIKEWLRNGYLRCSLNAKMYSKHRIVAQQWIPNDDPENKTQVDHINHIKTDNRIENLRWCSASENMRNLTGCKNASYEFFDEIPCENQEDIIEVRDYNGHEFEDLYFIDDFFYQWNGIQYKRLHINYTKSGLAQVCPHNLEGTQCSIYYTKFKRLYGLD